MYKLLSYLLVLVTMTMLSCKKESLISQKDQILISLDGAEPISLGVPDHRDSYHDCSIGFLRSATNRIEDYRNCNIGIYDCDLKNQQFPYKVKDYFMFYSKGANAYPDGEYSSTNFKDRVTITLTRVQGNILEGTFKGSLSVLNTPQSTIAVDGKFYIIMRDF